MKHYCPVKQNPQEEETLNFVKMPLRDGLHCILKTGAVNGERLGAKELALSRSTTS